MDLKVKVTLMILEKSLGTALFKEIIALHSLEGTSI